MWDDPIQTYHNTDIYLRLRFPKVSSFPVVLGVEASPMVFTHDPISPGTQKYGNKQPSDIVSKLDEEIKNALCLICAQFWS